LLFVPFVIPETGFALFPRQHSSSEKQLGIGKLFIEGALPAAPHTPPPAVGLTMPYREHHGYFGGKHMCCRSIMQRAPTHVPKYLSPPKSTSANEPT